MPANHPYEPPGALAAALVSTVFLTAHWLDAVESREAARSPITAANPT